MFWRPREVPVERHRRDDVLDAIGTGKLDLARSWGLRAARSPPNPNGWMGCHALRREDQMPSASFHYADGVYQDRKDGRTISFFDVGAELGAFDSW